VAKVSFARRYFGRLRLRYDCTKNNRNGNYEFELIAAIIPSHLTHLEDRLLEILSESSWSRATSPPLGNPPFSRRVDRSFTSVALMSLGIVLVLPPTSTCALASDSPFSGSVQSSLSMEVSLRCPPRLGGGVLHQTIC
jgi:hypothetical protein